MEKMNRKYDKRKLKRKMLKEYKRDLIIKRSMIKANSSIITMAWINKSQRITKLKIKNMNNLCTTGRNVNLYLIKKYYKR